MSDINTISSTKKKKFSLVLPVLFYEYLAISLCKSVIPTMVVNEFGKNAYFAVGITETVKVGLHMRMHHYNHIYIYMCVCACMYIYTHACNNIYPMDRYI